MKPIGVRVRQELVHALRERYRVSMREEKARILEEFVAVSGYHRKYAIRVLNGDINPDNRTRRRIRPRLYDEAVRQAMIVLWEAADRVCGKRLKALLPVLVLALERHGHLCLEEALRAKLLAASAATIDRLLRGARAAGQPKRRRLPTPLRQSVPVRTFADWGDPPPGNMETDLVAHCGNTPAGSYVHTLVLTDIASGWVECIALVVRQATLVVAALEGLRLSMPFPLRGLDIDNGSEFLNETLLHYCVGHGIELTRSRPYHKNDQAWVEQKNGAVVRRLVGYRRFEGLEAAQALSRLYAASRLFVNFFQPSFKLAEKTRVGARVSKRYHAPLTPCARLLASEAVAEQVKVRLREIAETLDPLRLLDEIRKMQHHLAALADGEQPHTPLSPHEDLGRFLASLSTAWCAGEVRPTHCAKPRPSRQWRTRTDPFASVWPELCRCLEVEPDQTGLQLFERLQREHPGVFPDGQLRTLQRRLKDWRTQAARRLVFGVQDDTMRIMLPGKISSEAAGKILM